ncbi:MAG: SgcJ/EcaC family oxidoreductase [Burkholderiaceae bacterium]
MMSNIEVIREFVQAWSELDAAKLAGYFTQDGCYHNMPTAPVKGRENVEKFIEKFLANWTQTQWEILNISAQGDLVYCERIDRTKTTTGDVDLPCFGVFEMKDGKILEWRDYFDLATYTRAVSGEKR